MKFLIAPLKTLTNTKNCSDFPLLSLGDYFQFTFTYWFRNNFQDHRQVSEQLLTTQAAIRNPKQALWRGWLEGISQLVSYFIEESRNLIFYFNPKKKKNGKTISAHSISIVSSFRTIKKYSSRDTIPLRSKTEMNKDIFLWLSSSFGLWGVLAFENHGFD